MPIEKVSIVGTNNFFPCGHAGRQLTHDAPIIRAAGPDHWRPRVAEQQLEGQFGNDMAAAQCSADRQGGGQAGRQAGRGVINGESCIVKPNAYHRVSILPVMSSF